MSIRGLDVTTVVEGVRQIVINVWNDKTAVSKRLVGRAEYYGAVLALVTYATILLVNVLMRTFFGSQIALGQEVVLGLFAWSTWLGAAYVVKTHQHLRFTGVITKLSNRWTYAVLWVEWILWLVFSAVAVRYSVDVVRDYQTSNAVLTATDIPTAVMFASVPVGFGLIVLRVLEQVIVVSREFKNGNDLDEYVELGEEV
jgi:TRAP-type C4-dicarboxylate transport system permease small subunit